MFRFALRANVSLLACFCLLAVACWQKIASRFARMLFHVLVVFCLLLASFYMQVLAILLLHALAYTFSLSAFTASLY